MVADVETPRAGRRSCAAGSSRPAARVWRARGALAALLVLMPAGLDGCSSVLKATPAAHVAAASIVATPKLSSGCSKAVLTTFSTVLQRVYDEGIVSERTASARYMITTSAALRTAVSSGNRAAAQAAARSLLSSGHMTNVTVVRGGRPFIDIGAPALAPLRGTLPNAAGAPVASYLTSVWNDKSFLTEAGGVTQGLVALRAHGQALGDSPTLPRGPLANEGALARGGIAYRYTSFPVEVYPSGSARVYALLPVHSIAKLCGRTTEDTTVNTLQHVAELIYAAEVGHAAQAQLHRVERNRRLLEAVARREPEATRRAIDALLNEHVVRIRVSVGGRLLSDVGGPYVLGPVSAALRLRGHTIGELTLSIQDDEGYQRLARRLAGLDVLMYVDPARPQLVKDSLGAGPGPALATVPASGPFRYRGSSYRVFTVHAEAFPSGPLVIRAFVPIPYP
jgi:hypothetical protein